LDKNEFVLLRYFVISSNLKERLPDTLPENLARSAFESTKSDKKISYK